MTYGAGAEALELHPEEDEAAEARFIVPTRVKSSSPTALPQCSPHLRPREPLLFLWPSEPFQQNNSKIISEVYLMRRF